MSVRVRYAPSPTGLQHIGSLRTALFNYFYARSKGGSFILRVEDTDQTRFDPRALQDIYDTFDWIGIHWDEGPDVGGDHGPYVQSEKQGVYSEHAHRLVDEGKAYKCFCTEERLEALREAQVREKSGHQGYDRHCRNLSSEEVAAKEAAGEPYVIRFKIPLEGETLIHDEVLGDTKRKNKDISPDPVLLKTDGFPTYHLAVIIDDHDMEVTDILRAQEWLSSAALHVLLYEAFGWKVPRFVHLPLVMGKDGSKLSKRHGSTSIIEFRKEGYLPEALVNYVVTVGWGYDETTEFFSIAELEKVFADGKINKAPGVFDYKKLQWYNAAYIRGSEDSRIIDLCLPYMVEQGLISTADAENEASDARKTLAAVMPLAKERMRLLPEICDVTAFLFTDVKLSGPEDLVQKKQEPSETLAVLTRVRDDLPKLDGMDEEGFHGYFEALAGEMETGMGKVMMPIRMAVTGSKASPPLSDSFRLVGIDSVKARIEQAISLLA